MTEKNNWKNWNINQINKIEDQISESFLLSKKFKLLVFIFLLLIFTILNIKFLEVLSIAEGKVIPQGRIKYIQHLEGGIVDKILVKEGDQVQVNQPLVILSKAKASSEYEEIKARINSVELSILRVKAEKKSLKKIPDNEIVKKFDSELIKFENEFLKSRRDKINSEKNILKKNIENLSKRLELLKEQASISEELLKAEATNRYRHIELLRELSNLEGKLDEERNKLESMNLSINEDLNNELSLLKKEKQELIKKIQKYSDNLNRTILKSPVSGIIKLISVNSKGAIVAPGVTVVEVVPENEKLIIEAKLPLSEIGYVNQGLLAKIRLNSPEGSRFRPIKGKVVFISSDRINETEEDSYYLVKIETNQKSFYKQDEEYKLFSGVPVVVGIITGKRSFLDYFLTPLKSKITFALTER